MSLTLVGTSVIISNEGYLAYNYEFQLPILFSRILVQIRSRMQPAVYPGTFTKKLNASRLKITL